VNVRLIEPADFKDYSELLERTSDEDRYCRFFHVVKCFDPREVLRFVEARPDVVGLIAEERGRKLGVAHGFVLGANSAETAILVAQDARRQGVGLALMTGLIEALRERGCSPILAYSLSGNAAFASLARAAGMRPETVEGGTVTWALDEAA
jgi:GNAT superfamily N-acetyltransferase